MLFALLYVVGAALIFFARRPTRRRRPLAGRAEPTV
jgi:hypothetical protein